MVFDRQWLAALLGCALMGSALADEPCPPSQPAESGRRSSTIPVIPYEPEPCDPKRISPAPMEEMGSLQGFPDRWRIVEAIGIKENLLDPYNGHNRLKGDRPMFGEDWYLAFIGISDTVFEPRSFPLPVGGPVTARPESLNTFGSPKTEIWAQTFALETVLYKGNTTFKPPDWEFRFTPAFNVTRVSADERGLLRAPADASKVRYDSAVGLQAAFVDRHLRNVSPNYDFDSIRVGIQPFTSDFRGFLLNDAMFGARLFGIRSNNRYQYNLAWFRRLDKDTNSGLNDVFSRGLASFRDDDVFAANLYVQDWPTLGFFTQGTVIHNRNREGGQIQYDDNGIIQRPVSLGVERSGDYDVTYLGLSGDGHIGGLNLSTSAYYAIGDAERGTFVDRPQQIRAGFFAAELSKDFSWVRARASLAWGSADSDPFDGRGEGFDAIFENPLFAGADTSFWIREPVPLIGGGRVTLSGRNGLLNSLRSSKEFGQSNFANPGLKLIGVGADFDLTPTLRISTNVNWLQFVDTATLRVARAQGDIDKDIGVDASIAVIWRPLAIQNVVGRLSVATLVPGEGYRDLFEDDMAYAVLGNLVLTY